MCAIALKTSFAHCIYNARRTADLFLRATNLIYKVFAARRLLFNKMDAEAEELLFT